MTPIRMPAALFALSVLLPLATAQDALPVQTVEFDTPAVGRTLKYNIILPEGYEGSQERYPTLYLLHGLTSNYTAWARMRVPEYAASYDMIVVMPDAGNSWYVNFARSDEGEKNAWEDYMIEDLIGHVDANFRTIAKREGRAINGLSMGGFGALMLGLRHPDMFCSIGSHSGALEYARGAKARMVAVEASAGAGRGGRRGRARRTPSDRDNPGIAIDGFSSQLDRTPKGVAFATPADCDKYDPFTLVLQIPVDQLPHIYIDCGTEDRLISGARRLADLLRENTIPFTYAESPGRHAGAYWAREVGHSMAVQYTILQRNLRD